MVDYEVLVISGAFLILLASALFVSFNSVEDVVMFDNVSCEFDDYFLVESYVMRDNVFYADLDKVTPLESVGGGLFVRVEN